MAHYTTYQASLKYAPTDIFHGRTPHSTLDLSFANPICLTNWSMEISKMLDDVKEKYKQNVHYIVTAHPKNKT